jgi:hypothetical protein
MALTFKEACTAVADLYEAIPETHLTGLWIYADTFCAVGGVADAIKADKFMDIDKLLSPYAKRLGYPSAIYCNDFGGTEAAIKMLRLAAAEAA